MLPGLGSGDLETDPIATTTNWKQLMRFLQKQAEKCIKAVPSSPPANTSGRSEGSYLGISMTFSHLAWY